MLEEGVCCSPQLELDRDREKVNFDCEPTTMATKLRNGSESENAKRHNFVLCRIYSCIRAYVHAHSRKTYNNISYLFCDQRLDQSDSGATSENNSEENQTSRTERRIASTFSILSCLSRISKEVAARTLLQRNNSPFRTSFLSSRKEILNPPNSQSITPHSLSDVQLYVFQISSDSNNPER